MGGGGVRTPEHDSAYAGLRHWWAHISTGNKCTTLVLRHPRPQAGAEPLHIAPASVVPPISAADDQLAPEYNVPPTLERSLTTVRVSPPTSVCHTQAGNTARTSCSWRYNGYKEAHLPRCRSPPPTITCKQQTWAEWLQCSVVNLRAAIMMARPPRHDQLSAIAEALLRALKVEGSHVARADSARMQSRRSYAATTYVNPNEWGRTCCPAESTPCTPAACAMRTHYQLWS